MNLKPQKYEPYALNRAPVDCADHKASEEAQPGPLRAARDPKRAGHP